MQYMYMYALLALGDGRPWALPEYIWAATKSNRVELIIVIWDIYRDRAPIRSEPIYFLFPMATRPKRVARPCILAPAVSGCGFYEASSSELAKSKLFGTQTKRTVKLKRALLRVYEGGVCLTLYIRLKLLWSCWSKQRRNDLVDCIPTLWFG